jgi:integration host factor subunit alpha
LTRDYGLRIFGNKTSGKNTNLAAIEVYHRSSLPMTLTKAHIVNVIHDQLGFSRKECSLLVEQLLEIIKNTLENGEDVLISGFGKFCVKNKKQRRGRNPATGDDMLLDKRRVVTFRCSHVLREKINT